MLCIRTKLRSKKRNSCHLYYNTFLVSCQLLQEQVQGDSSTTVKLQAYQCPARQLPSWFKTPFLNNCFFCLCSITPFGVFRTGQPVFHSQTRVVLSRGCILHECCRDRSGTDYTESPTQRAANCMRKPTSPVLPMGGCRIHTQDKRFKNFFKDFKI